MTKTRAERVIDRLCHAGAWGVIANALVGAGAAFGLYAVTERERFALSIAAAFAAFVALTFKRWYGAGASQD